MARLIGLFLLWTVTAAFLAASVQGAAAEPLPDRDDRAALSECATESLERPGFDPLFRRAYCRTETGRAIGARIDMRRASVAADTPQERADLRALDRFYKERSPFRFFFDTGIERSNNPDSLTGVNGITVGDLFFQVLNHPEPETGPFVYLGAEIQLLPYDPDPLSSRLTLFATFSENAFDYAETRYRLRFARPVGAIIGAFEISRTSDEYQGTQTERRDHVSVGGARFIGRNRFECRVRREEIDYSQLQESGSLYGYGCNITRVYGQEGRGQLQLYAGLDLSRENSDFLYAAQRGYEANLGAEIADVPVFGHRVTLQGTFSYLRTRYDNEMQIFGGFRRDSTRLLRVSGLLQSAGILGFHPEVYAQTEDRASSLEIFSYDTFNVGFRFRSYF